MFFWGGKIFEVGKCDAFDVFQTLQLQVQNVYFENLRKLRKYITLDNLTRI